MVGRKGLDYVLLNYYIIAILEVQNSTFIVFGLFCVIQICARKTLNVYLIRIYTLICLSSTPNYSFGVFLSKYPKIYERQCLTAITNCVYKMSFFF